jgi:hypothetical protein
LLGTNPAHREGAMDDREAESASLGPRAVMGKKAASPVSRTTSRVRGAAADRNRT